MPRKKAVDSNVVSTALAVSLALDIPIDHVKTFKKLGCAAASSTGRYYLKEIQSWYAANKGLVEEFLENEAENKVSKSNWKDRKGIAQAIIAEIQQRELEGKTLDKEKVITFLKQIAGSQAIMLRNMAQELPHKLLGKNITDMQVILSKNYDDICSLLKQELDKWDKK